MWADERILEKLFETIETIDRRLLSITRTLHKMEKQQEIIMATVSESLTELENATAAIDGAEKSAEAAFIRLATMIENLKSNQTDPATAARITAAAEALRAQAASLGAAVAAAPA